MKTTKNGGHAFPALDLHIGTNGMTLRDNFAGQVLAGLCASVPARRGSPENAREDAILHAQGAYLYADAMIFARKVPPASPHASNPKQK